MAIEDLIAALADVNGLVAAIGQNAAKTVGLVSKVAQSAQSLKFPPRPPAAGTSVTSTKAAPSDRSAGANDEGDDALSRRRRDVVAAGQQAIADAAEKQQRRLTGLSAAAVASVEDAAIGAEEMIADVGYEVVASIGDAGSSAVDEIVYRANEASSMLSVQLQSMLNVVQSGAGGASGMAWETDREGNLQYDKATGQPLFTSDPNKMGMQVGGAITYDTAYTWVQKYIELQQYLEQKAADRNPFKVADAQRGMQQYADLFERVFPQLGRISDLALEMRNMMGRSDRRKLPQYTRPRGPGLRTRFRRSRFTGRI